MQTDERLLIGGLAAMGFALAALVAGGLYVVVGLMLVAAGSFLLYQGIRAHDSHSPGDGHRPHA